MPISLNALLENELNSGTIELRLALIITATDDVLADRVWRFSDGKVHASITNEYVPVISKVSPTTREIDPISRKFSSGKIIVTMVIDENVREMLTTYRLVGCGAEVRVGTPNLADESYFATLSVGTIREISPDFGERRLTITIDDTFAYLRDEMVAGLWWYNQHPLQVISDVLTRAGVGGSFVVSADWDPSQSKYANMAHLVVNNLVSTPVSSLDLLTQLALIADITITVDEDGKIRGRFFDETAAAQDSWTDDDLMDFQQAEAVGPIINRITVKQSRITDANSKVTEVAYQRNDTTSQTNWGRVYETELDFGPWMPEFIDINGAISAGAGAGATFVMSAVFAGFTGLRWTPNTFPSGSQPAAAAVNGTTRIMYLKVDNEIISIDLVTANTTMMGIQTILDPESGSTPPVHAVAATLRILARAVDGTSQVAHTAATRKIHDITGARWVATRKLSRHKDGAPIIRCKTSWAKLKYQIGELVTLVTSRYLAYGYDGLTTAVKWEIIGKQPDPYADPPCIEWTLMRAYDSSLPAEVNTAAAIDNEAFSLMHSFAERLGAFRGEVLENHTTEGMASSSPSGLNVTVSAGTATGVISRAEIPATTLEVVANRDTYLFLNVINKEIVAKDVATGAAAPEARPYEIPLSKVVAGASVSSVVDRRITAAMQTSVLANSGTEILADNPGFEYGDIGWEHTSGTWFIESSTPRTGSFSASCTAGVSTLRNVQEVKCEAGDVFYAECWARVAGGGSGGFYARVRWLDGDGADLSTSDATEVTASTTYQKSSFTATAPANAKYACVVCVRSTAGSGLMYFDDVRFEHAKDSHLVVDGAIAYQHFTMPAMLGSGSLFNTNMVKKLTAP